MKNSNKPKLALLKVAALRNCNTSAVWKFFIFISVLIFFLIGSPTYGANQSVMMPERIADVINQERIKSGLIPYQLNQKLQIAAKEKAEHMLKNGYFAHTSPEGLEPWQFIENSGFAYSFAGENLAMNYTSEFELVFDLLQSPSHKDNLLSLVFTEIGVAAVSGEYQGKHAIFIVQMFASPTDRVATK